jgi:predicted nucleic-acid-binding protein
MIGLDTNVVVRYMMDDDAVQSPIANRLFESFTAEAPGLISLVTLIELVWVLRSSYDATREQTQRAIEILLRSRGLIIEGRDLVRLALSAYSQGTADFPDYLIESHGHAAGCDYSVTFDRNASISAGMKLLR